MEKTSPIVLIILDGWGHKLSGDNNAIYQAKTPTWDHLLSHYPNTTLCASGLEVGLPKDQMGNSEVGHLTIGAGHPVQQDLTRIACAIENKSFYDNPVFLNACHQARENSCAIHLMGLFSPGGVHSHEDHWFSFIRLAVEKLVPTLYLHPFLDGRDTPPQSAKNSLEKLERLSHHSSSTQITIGSLCGRYYAMDRDNRFERIQPVYDLLTEGQSTRQANSALAALQIAYDCGETDEFVTPTLINPSATIQDGDIVVFLNFRTDRARQLSRALTDPDFKSFPRNKVVHLSHFITMTQYAEDIASEVAFPPTPLKNLLGECLASKHLKQLRIAETEKYAHVTFFLNGGQESAYTGEDRILIPSPKVATYDLIPEMSAQAITDVIVKALKQKTHDVVICNYANADMVGHTGNLKATIKAIEFLDQCLGELLQTILTVGGELLITADHGNAEIMFDEATQQPHTAHTHERVPFVYIGRSATIVNNQGSLSDVAPTLLSLLNLDPPPEMQGSPLVKLT